MPNILSIGDPEKLLDRYDHDGELEWVVAYGSGAIEQKNHKKPGMPDFMFGVKNPQAWHRKNAKAHPHDYWLPQVVGAINAVQDWGPGITYLPFVPYEGKEIKYGVIDTRRAINDLCTWKHLYVAGRMQKPVQILRNHDGVEQAQEINLEAAVAAARLLLPEKFTEQELYYTIASLSYMGDIRMRLGGEKAEKARNIVDGSRLEFAALYKDALASSPELYMKSDGECMQGMDKDTRDFLMIQLPESISSDPEIRADADPENVREVLRKRLKKIVKSSSFSISVKGLITSGPIRSVRYAGTKILKALGWR